MRNTGKVHASSAKSLGASPWSAQQRAKQFLWQVSWALLCNWTPKPFNTWRLWVLKAFGARIHGRPFVHQRARIQIPWNLTLHDRACIGDQANLYTLGAIEIGARSVIAQEAYLATGSHDFGHPNLPLTTGPIRIGSDAFIAARAFVMPGVTIGDGAVIGAMSVVTKDVEAWTYNVGNPCRKLRRRDKSNFLDA